MTLRSKEVISVRESMIALSVAETEGRVTVPPEVVENPTITLPTTVLSGEWEV